MSKLRRKVKLHKKFASFFSADRGRRMLKASAEEAFKVSQIRGRLGRFRARDGRR
jgi:hypothetical protein